MDSYLKRLIYKELEESLEDYPVVAILGPRQVGKSTLVRDLLEVESKVYLDLELSSEIRKLSEPEIFFDRHVDSLICLDEIQLAPEIFKTIRGTVDKNKKNSQFLILGSASRDLLRQSSESLAGRISYLEIMPFNILEVGVENFEKLWVRGGFPKSFLAANNEKSSKWRENYIRTYLERDIPQLGFNIPAKSIERLWRMLAHSHGQTLNSSKIASSLGVSSHTVNSYIDILEQTFLVKSLRAFEPNIKKQYIKSPKVYLRDTGLLHTFLNLESFDDLLGHQVFGSSFEGFVIENLMQIFPRWKFHYYRNKSGAEIDLIMSKGNRRLAIEIKASKAPKLARGFWTACNDINATDKFVISMVDDSYEIQNNTYVTNLELFLKEKANEM
ncbi:MAG: ATP-binding protein [Bacteriovoracaceae bacterium]